MFSHTLFSNAKRCSYVESAPTEIPNPSPPIPLIAFENLSLSMVIWNSSSRPRQIDVDQGRPKQVCKYPSIPSMQVSKYPSIPSMQIPKYPIMQECKYASMQVCKYANMQVFTTKQTNNTNKQINKLNIARIAKLPYMAKKAFIKERLYLKKGYI